MPRERAQIDLGGPLLREREGCKLTQRSLSSRLAEVIERLERVTAAAAPSLPDRAWSLICWSGWDAIQHARWTADRPEDADALAWLSLVSEVAEAKEPWAPELAATLHRMGPIERVAVLERIEAYGRAEAMRSA